MAKRSKSVVPCPDSLWYTEGRTRAPGVVHRVREQLKVADKFGVIAHHREFDPREESEGNTAWWGFDIAWRTEDGARVEARLNLVPDALEATTKRLTSQMMDADETLSVDMGWRITAESDQPWREEWTSPALMFFPPDAAVRWDLDWVSRALVMHDYTVLTNRRDVVNQFPRFLKALSEIPWYTVVITHDRRSQDEADSAPVGGLVRMLPPSAVGQVLEIRIHDIQDQLVNEWLEPFRVTLPWGGAVILPQSPRRDNWQSADYSLKPPPGGDMNRMMQKAALLVMRYQAGPTHMHARMQDGLADLHDHWVLPEVELAPSHILDQRDEAEERAREAYAELAEVKRLLEAEREARTRAERIAEDANASATELSRAIREHPLQEQAREAAELRDAALASADSAQLLLEKSVAEVAWLRRQLAQVPGRSYGEEAPPRPSGPQSWEEMASLVGELMPHVALGDIWGPLEKLRQHKHEDVWLRRTWDSLEALEAYAEAKEEHGADMLPHFQAYLNWREAKTLVPANMYCASEANLRRNDSRFAEVRMFEVPGKGLVFMQEHFRIGGIRPPAPRMHVYDDTAGDSGKIHVGYLGPHLPNGKSV
jgi:hypothetical protein